MRALDYALRQGWISLRRARGSTAVAVVAIALALLVLGALLLAAWNAARVADRLAAAAEFSVYLRDDASSEQRGAIEAALRAGTAVSGLAYVSKAEAEARFSRQYADLAPVADELGSNPFPASIEVRIRADADHPAEVEPLVAAVAAMPGVEDVRYDREWLARLGSGLRTAGLAGLALAALMALAAAVTVAAVVRLSLLARQDEVEIMELVGAPLLFIRGPFVAEGLLQGGMGALAALLALWAGYAALQAWWGGALPLGLEGPLAFLPLRLCLAVVVGGMLVGGAGGFAASRHAGRVSDPGR